VKKKIRLTRVFKVIFKLKKKLTITFKANTRLFIQKLKLIIQYCNIDYDDAYKDLLIN